LKLYFTLSVLSLATSTLTAWPQSGKPSK